MAFLCGDEAARLRALRARQVVPNHKAYEDPQVGGDPVLSAFRRQAESAEPMPSTPAMRMVWTPYDKALQMVVTGHASPAAALAEAEREKQISVANANKLREIGTREAIREQAVRIATLDKEQKVGEATAALGRCRSRHGQRAVHAAMLDKEQKVGEQAAGFERRKRR
jgi:hypothetical protein